MEETKEEYTDHKGSTSLEEYEVALRKELAAEKAYERRLQEYKDNLKNLDATYEASKKELHIAFAKSNNPYVIGDIISDDAGSILVDKIGYTMNYAGTTCSCCYRGWVLRKDLQPRKDRSIRWVYQPRINEAK